MAGVLTTGRLPAECGERAVADRQRDDRATVLLAHRVQDRQARMGGQEAGRWRGCPAGDRSRTGAIQHRDSRRVRANEDHHDGKFVVPGS
jgi:hypothetical protein